MEKLEGKVFEKVKTQSLFIKNMDFFYLMARMSRKKCL